MKIAVLLGGNSPEREVSLASGEQIAKALKELGHEVIRIDPAMGAQVVPEDVELLPSGVGRRPPTLEELPEDSHIKTIEAVRFLAHLKVDVVFNGLHGGIGEDGTIQGLLELSKIPFTGSGVLASALAMNKAMAKRVFERVGVTTPPWLLYKWGGEQSTEELTKAIESHFGFPAVVKPNNQGSTVGFSVVRTPEELPQAVEAAAIYGPHILIERYIPGREITVSILEDRALPVIEIKPKHGVYDYECKYTPGMTEYEVPANLPESVTRHVQEQALRAFRALQCSQYGRVDLRLDPEMQPYCLEINTLPGMTKTSLVPKAARAVGMDFPSLVQRIVEIALEGR